MGLVLAMLISQSLTFQKAGRLVLPKKSTNYNTTNTYENYARSKNRCVHQEQTVVLKIGYRVCSDLSHLSPYPTALNVTVISHVRNASILNKYPEKNLSFYSLHGH